MKNIFVLFAFVFLLTICGRTIPPAPGPPPEPGNGLFCTNANYDALDTHVSGQPNFAKCDRFRDKFQSSMDKYGLTGKIDLLMVYAIAMQESRCTTGDEMRAKGVTRADGGIMQVDGACLKDKNCPDVNTEIDEGIKELKQKYAAINAKGLDPLDGLVLVLFSYNRGLKTALDAADNLGSQNIIDAMDRSCRKIYKKPGKGCLYCQYDSRGVDKCNGPGYGTDYPQRIITYFADACIQAGGNISPPNNGLPATDVSGDVNSFSPELNESVDEALETLDNNEPAPGPTPEPAPTQTSWSGTWSGRLSFTNNCPSTASCRYIGGPGSVTIQLTQTGNGVRGTLYLNTRAFSSQELPTSNRGGCPILSSIVPGSSEISGTVNPNGLTLTDVGDDVWTLGLTANNHLEGSVSSNAPNCMGIQSNDVRLDKVS